MTKAVYKRDREGVMYVLYILGYSPFDGRLQMPFKKEHRTLCEQDYYATKWSDDSSQQHRFVF